MSSNLQGKKGVLLNSKFHFRFVPLCGVTHQMNHITLLLDALLTQHNVCFGNWQIFVDCVGHFPCQVIYSIA